MPETAYEERSTTQGVYELIHSIDKNVRDISSELYVFRRETEHKLEAIAADISSLKKDNSELKRESANLKEEVAELKQEVKELHRDVSDIKGDIKAIAAGFGAAQNRFNWGLIILGLFVALIQLLK